MSRVPGDLRDVLRRRTRLDEPRSRSILAQAQIREIAERILLSESLAEKLAKIPTTLADDRPGPARRDAVPGSAAGTHSLLRAERPRPCPGRARFVIRKSGLWRTIFSPITNCRPWK